MSTYIDQPASSTHIIWRK